MKCISCESEISSKFKHALAKNECPACGEEILDEESLVLMDHIKTTLSGEANLRKETLQRLALVLVTTYDFSVSSLSEIEVKQKVDKIEEGEEIKEDEEIEEGEEKPKIKKVKKTKKTGKKKEKIKVASKSIIKEIAENKIVNDEEMQEMDALSQEERDKIMEEVVRQRYNMVDSSVVGDYTSIDGSLFPENEGESVLEQERRMRLAKQQRVLEGGSGGAFRRSS